MLILGLETSCDETGVALYDTALGLLAHRLHSQIDMHAAYGGVVPELASRDHIVRIVPLIDNTIKDCKRSLIDISAIAVTQGPGLGGALLVGTSVARSVAAPIDAAAHLKTLVLHGEQDDTVLLADVMDWARPQALPVTVIPGGGHFFHGQLPLLKSLVIRHLASSV